MFRGDELWDFCIIDGWVLTEEGEKPSIKTKSLLLQILLIWIFKIIEILIGEDSKALF